MAFEVHHAANQTPLSTCRYKVLFNNSLATGKFICLRMKTTVKINQSAVIGFPADLATHGDQIVMWISYFGSLQQRICGSC